MKCGWCGDARPDLAKIDWSAFAQQIEGAARGALNTMQAALPGMRGRQFGRITLRRVTTIEEFADAVLFFLSPWSRAVSGQNLLVDGGLVKN
jgi:NAD(P)-dependent dehydrogenase (short-subunit alcohol dehydrogenase family)